ncbi:MAG: DUF5060 domain-containing protein [Opitutales bacterium]
MAAPTGATVTASSGQIQSVSAAGTTILAASLITGNSTGATLDAMPITLADDFDLFSYFARNATAPSWTVDLGTWTDANGNQPDFFLYEYGSNDAFTVAAILPGNVVGQAISIPASLWQSTGINAPGGPNNGQPLGGVAWAITDLLDASGVALDNSSEITGLQIESATIDAASLVAAVAEGQGGGPPPVDFGPSAAQNTPTAGVFGELRQWHRVTVAFEGPDTSEDAIPNPFTDYRLNVTFHHPATGTTYLVPGYYAADGHAGETSATSGNIWRAHLSPDFSGEWTWQASLRMGDEIAISTDPTAGISVPLTDSTGDFTILPTDKVVPDFRACGRLEYVGERYLQFAGTGEYFVKAGADSPENFLANPEIDGTFNRAGTNFLRTWGPHLQDWEEGDPNWQNGQGRGLIGALNYLASESQNVFSFLTYNAGGDGDDVWMYVEPTDPLRFDTSKLDQWEIIFAHAQALGIYLHFKTQEQEMDNDPPFGLDAGAVELERRLYYRELIARYGHHLALNWNLGEENTQTTAQRREMAQFFHDNDPYGHNIVLHTFPGQTDSVYSALVGNQSKLTGISIQKRWDQVHEETLQWVEESEALARPWVVANDEIGPANRGVPPDSSTSGTPSQAQVRQVVLWGNLMAGGAGVEFYFGGSADQALQDWRTRDRMWDFNRHALTFFNTYLPFWEMNSDNALVGNPNDNNTDYAFAKRGEIYAVFLTDGGTVDLDLEAFTDTFTVSWFDPRDGGPLQTGTVETITGPGPQSIGLPPSDTSEDWAALIRLQSLAVNTAPDITPDSFRVIEGSPASTSVGMLPASDPDPGQSLTYAITGGNDAGAFQVDPNTGLISVADPAPLVKLSNPFFRLEITVTDNGVPSESVTADATVLVEHAVAGKRVLFIRGASGTGGLGGGNDNQLADLFNTAGNTNFVELRQLLEGEGYIVEQMIEGTPIPGENIGQPIDFASMDLSVYDVIVFSSNNADYLPGGDTSRVDAIEEWVRNGGGALFFSDANFGRNFATAPTSDQQFLDRFGLTVYQDRGTYGLFAPDDFLVPEHPILAGFPEITSDDISGFDGEGVSPFTLNPVTVPGANITFLTVAKGGIRFNDGSPQGSTGQSDSGDSTLVVVDIGVGRVVGHFDRNTFFSDGGAGTDLTRFDNTQFALNLFRWLTGGGQDAFANYLEAAFDADFGVPALEATVWGPLANPDDDPFNNLLEFFLALDPDNPELDAITFAFEDGQGVLTFPMANELPSNVAGLVEYTEDFSDWFTESVTLISGDDLGDATVMRAFLPVPLSGNQFGRLRVTQETAD